MSSMIRSVNSILRAQSLTRIFNVTRTSQYFCNLQSQNVNFQRNVHMSPFSFNSETNVDRSLTRLDNEIRKTGRINRREIEEVLQDIKDMKKATRNQSLMIIRCCGELVPGETPENRTKLVEEVWKTFETLNVPMDISHYNALLRVYLENEYKFNPEEFLLQLSSKGIEPNRVTYQRLIARFCQDGDIDGASTILQHMKEKQLPINEHVFNALVLGHAQANDMDSAEGIISVMRQAGLEPNDDTYSTLMCGYAKKGDMENVERIIKDCTDKEVFLVDRDFLNVIFALASSGNDELVDQVIPHLKKHSGFNQDATNVIFRLVNIGKEDVAFKILKIMPRGIRQDEMTPSGNFFIKQMVRSATPSEKLIRYCKEMEKDGLNHVALFRATEMALALRNFEKATDLLEAMQQDGSPIRQHYFWPFFASSQSEKDVYDGLKSMIYLGVNPNIETLREYVIPALLSKNKSKNTIEKTLEKLCTHTQLSANQIGVAALQYLIVSHQLDAAAKFAIQYRARLNPQFIRRALVEAYLKSKNAKSFVQIVGTASSEDEDNSRESVGIVVLDLLDATRSSKDKAKFLLPVLKEFLAAGLGLSNSGAELIQNNLGDDVTDEINSIILKLTSSNLTSKIGMRVQGNQLQSRRDTLDDLTTLELEQMLEQSIKAGNPNKSIQKNLLFSYCRERQFEKAEALRKELTDDGFVLQVGLKALFLDLYSQQDRLPEAKAMYAEIIESLDTTIDTIKTLRYASLLITHGEYQECLDVLKKQAREESLKGKNTTPHSALVWKMLNTLAESKNVEQVMELFSTLNDNGYLNINNSILGPLVKVHLLREDLDSALAEFERCVKEHHCTPLKQELFCRFIKNDDADNLQKVMDLSTNLHGEVNSLYDLVFAFIQCGKVRQARKILETPGIRARNDKLEYTCQRLMDENRVPELENLIEVTKDLLDVDRNSMYYFLLQAYCNAGNVEKAEGIWARLQEENVHPSTHFLTYLADFLRKNDRPVPFVAPDPTVVSPKSDDPDIKKFREMLEINEIDKALQIKQRMESKGETFSFNDASLMIDKLTKAERLNEAVRLTEEMLELGNHPFPMTLRNLIGKLSNAGDIEVLCRIADKLTPDLKRKVMLDSRLCTAYASAGKGQEYIENYVKKEVDRMTGDPEKDFLNIPVSSMAFLLRSEELVSQVEPLAFAAAEKGNFKLNNALWIRHMMNKEFERSREIWNTTLISSPRVMFRSILGQSRNSKDEEIVKELHSQIQMSEKMTSGSKGVVVSCAPDVLCVNEKPEEALEYLKKSLVNTALEDVHTSSLTTLKEKLEAINKKFPYEIPKRSRASRRSNSSSSSSSDSD